MFVNMDADHSRFKKIIRGRVKSDLKGYITRGNLVTRLHQGGGRKQRVSIPLPSIELPRFAYGQPGENGSGTEEVGQGKGNVGDELKVAPGEGDKPGQGGKPSDKESEKVLEDAITLEELAELLGEELELPRIEDKGNKASLHKQRKSYSGIASQGPDSLKHFKRTYRTALKRSLASGIYDPLKPPVVIPIREDQRYRSFHVQEQPVSQAAIIYMMDVSGSMGEEQKELVRLSGFWLDTWLTSQYKDLERRFIIHDATAKVVDEKVFYRTKESGGTLISSAYRKAVEVIDKEFPADEWNIYLFHFSDGDNWSGNDTEECLHLLESVLLPAANLFGYGQTESRYGSGQFYGELNRRFGSEEKVIIRNMTHRDDIIDTLKAFLGTGR
ncbi:MAG: DUF444 family protein [Proteobacteria bacterium]|nr:DUF444 family protein [Pseudomonadota bacterium]